MFTEQVQKNETISCNDIKKPTSSTIIISNFNGAQIAVNIIQLAPTRRHEIGRAGFNYSHIRALSDNFNEFEQIILLQTEKNQRNNSFIAV